MDTDPIQKVKGSIHIWEKLKKYAEWCSWQYGLDLDGFF
jgi:hypothetical protein